MGCQINEIVRRIEEVRLVDGRTLMVRLGEGADFRFFHQNLLVGLNDLDGARIFDSAVNGLGVCCEGETEDFYSFVAPGIILLKFPFEVQIRRGMSIKFQQMVHQSGVKPFMRGKTFDF